MPGGVYNVRAGNAGEGDFMSSTTAAVETQPIPLFSAPLVHPHIERTDGVCGGRPVVRGSRITVKTLIGYHRMGYNLAEIMSGFAGLTAAQFYDALSYYYDHQAEVDADIEGESLTSLAKRFHLEVDADGVMRLTPQ
jgi:uncharacterized protein (DUF433 family)